jgi:hypothetical protein
MRTVGLLVVAAGGRSERIEATGMGIGIPSSILQNEWGHTAMCASLPDSMRDFIDNENMGCYS